MSQRELYEQSEEKINIKEVLWKYLRYWPLYLLTILIALIVAKIQLRYSPLIYSSYTTAKILDNSKESQIDLSGLNTGGNLFGQAINLENEIQILKSRRLLSQVVDSLNLYTSYYSKGQVRTSELYGSSIPFEIDWGERKHNIQLGSSKLYSVVFDTENSYTISTESGFEKEGVRFGQIVINGNDTFQLKKLPNSNYQQKAERQTLFSFQYKSGLKLAQSLSKKLIINQLGKGSEILHMSLLGPIPQKNEETLNTIVSLFDEDGKKDRKLVAERTEEFVEDRLRLIFNDLDQIEGSLAGYKQSNKLISIEMDAQNYNAKSEVADQDLFLLVSQMYLAKELQTNIEAEQAFQLIPANIGIQEGEINSLIQDYNGLVLSRRKILNSSTLDHPTVQYLSNQIEGTLENIKSSLSAYVRSLETRFNKLEQRRNTALSQLGTIPIKEKTLRKISREQSIKENLYLFLLEKKETASLTKAVIEPSVKVVDYAYTNPNPVSPNSRSKYTVAFFVGLILPLGFLYIRFLLDNKIHTKDDVSKVVKPFDIPIIGEIPEISKNINATIQPNDRSELAESFRVVRTNLNYLIGRLKKKDECKTIVVTSSTKSEGKTFTSLNLAITLASSDNRVLIIGADLRNPQLHHYLNLDKNTGGLTSFLFDESTQVKDILHKGIMGFDQLDIIISGFIPPNPAELLMNGRIEVLLEEVKEFYDYVIIDSAPTLLVTDTLLISQVADASVYLMRSNVTNKEILSHIIDVKTSKKLPHLGLVLNGIGKSGSYGYGYKYKYNYGYGYRYGEDQKKRKWWKFW